MRAGDNPPPPLFKRIGAFSLSHHLKVRPPPAPVFPLGTPTSAAFCRWKMGSAFRPPNPVHYMFEGLWVVLYTIWTHYGWAALFTTPIFFVDPVPVETHDWARLLLPQTQFTQIGVTATHQVCGLWAL